MFRQIVEVFTSEYKAETKYLNYRDSMGSVIKLKNASEDVNLKMLRLSDYNSQCTFEVGEFS